ncbi:hypothetical protein H6P81_001658 [Aristolochia fimbriata]|uniref:Uncharacterized protein n=1 Tax=Aristolochia fimbriata TaxID=158543 RepID=A0AAV7FA88_ARIFI|nr:hypothetical protein H6P81_001658 [Aristolochia fimbriata]
MRVRRRLTWRSGIKGRAVPSSSVDARTPTPSSSAASGLFLLAPEKTRRMGNFYEEKALGDEALGSLEGRVQAYFSGTLDADRFVDDAGDGEDGGSNGDAAAAWSVDFWQAQHSLLQELLSRGSSTGSILSGEVREAIEMARETGTPCRCNKLSQNGCSSCLRQFIIDHIRGLGYDAAFCTCAWKPSRDIPGGKHDFIDVVIPAAGSGDRYVIEPEFRSEFEMGKACNRYRKLILDLPEFYVGKPEHLSAVVRVICDAGKRSMKDSKMHMGPWRKRKFMQMKWAGPNYHRRSSSFSDQSPPVVRPRFAPEPGSVASTPCAASFRPTAIVAVI